MPLRPDQTEEVVDVATFPEFPDPDSLSTSQRRALLAEIASTEVPCWDWRASGLITRILGEVPLTC